MKTRILALACLFGLRLMAADAAFQLRPEWTGPCQKASAAVDVNLGNSPEAFVKAAWCQCMGAPPDEGTVNSWAARLKRDERLRRVDIVNAFIQKSGKPLAKKYSNPWLNNPELAPAAGARTGKREVGAVVMFFFNCPGGVNCGMDWANNHTLGMEGPDPSLGFGAQAAGVYDAKNPGFWKRELRDAKAAGLQFILPNVYGPDMANEGKVKTLAAALAMEKDPVKVGYFDDNWSWGEKWFGPFWQQKPDFNKPESAARLIYEAKWKPYFSTIPRKNWYLVKGRPLIYFYNSGKLNPLNKSAAVFRRMKEMFKKDFGVEPFLAAERAYFQDPDQQKVSDGKYTWDPIKFGDGYIGMVSNPMKGVTLKHAMVRWDAVGRDHPGQPAQSNEPLHKGPELLQKVLADSTDADLLVIATWNDLGEGTGINRAYDYYHLGQWLAPDTFIKIIRNAQYR